MNLYIKALLIAIFSILLTSCMFKNLNTYSSEQYTLEYPSTYSVEEPNEAFPVLTIKKEDIGKIEIFKHEDFSTPLSPTPSKRIHGYSSSGIEEFEAKLVPKEELEIGDYDVWLFYLKDDKQTKKEVHKIFESIKIKQN